MNKKYYIIWVLLFFSVFSAVYSFSIDDINQWIESDFNVDFKGDKINYKFSKQDQIKKDSNWGYINTWRDSYIDSEDNLNLDNIDKNDIEDNSQQWEAQEEFRWSVIPLNYEENRKENIEEKIIRKETSFRMEFYERWAIKVKNNLQLYYNPDLKDVLLWWIPSTFWFWNSNVSVWSEDLYIWESNGTTSWGTTGLNCSLSCDCGQYYSLFWQCYKVPPNSYSVWSWFKCLRWYSEDVSWELCLDNWTEPNDTVPISDSPFDGIRYKWIESIDEWDDPFWVKVIEWPAYTPYYQSTLWIWSNPYSWNTSDIINNYSEETYQDILSGSNWVYCIYTGDAYYNPSLCTIKKSSSIYDIQMTPIR